MSEILEFPVLNEAALKAPKRALEAAMDLKITPDTPQEVLIFAKDLILNNLSVSIGLASFEYCANEITVAADRLTEIARAIPEAPVCPEAGSRLRAWFCQGLPL
jgi:hypothetical protein